ncbi:MAG: GIY-YIG nuclease family protein [bacterium]|nr:GIY-YIG nuclease family protein [bacterium]
MVTFEKLKNLVNKFPNAPGVYFWLDKNKKPIYIGRAGSLKKRVASYFLTKDRRIQEMVNSAHGLKFQKTDTLLEAVILEANLIKKYWPKYNVVDKDNSSFIYLIITNEAFPRILTIRGRELEKHWLGGKSAKAIFGPYQSYRLLRSALEIVRRIFPYSTCQAAIPPLKKEGGRKTEDLEIPPGQAGPPFSKGRIKPCFHYQIGLCPGVCVGTADKKEYAETIRNLILFFRGDKKRLLARLKRQNPDAIKALQHVNDVSLLADSNFLLQPTTHHLLARIEGYDISHLSGKEPVGSMVVFINGEKDPSQYRLFKIRGTSVILSPSEESKKNRSFRLRQDDTRHYNDLAMLREVLERRLKHPEWPMPDIVFVDGGLLQVRTARDVLAKQKIFVPVIGLSKGGKHAGSAYATDKLVALNVKKIGKELLLSSKKLFQEVRNEAHRFAIGFNRRRSQKSSLSWRHTLK